MESTETWVPLYKFARLAFLGLSLVAIALYVYNPKRRDHLEAPAQRMLEDEE